MPCWTATETRVDLDAAGLDADRLGQAAREHGARVERTGGKVRLVKRSYSGSVDAEELTRLVKHAYSVLTVQAGLKAQGFVAKAQTREKTALGTKTLISVGAKALLGGR